MSYKQKTIANIIDEIDSRKIMLPSIQRKYVWEEDQITKLMDSIMRGYPFGTFLFWQVKKAIVNEKGYPMYEFIKDYHERDMFKNPHIAQPFSLAPENKEDTLYAVLDGQQRLTSLYIAFKGSLSKKIPKKRWSSPDAFPTKELYFNLLSKKNSEDDELQYKFKFLTPEEKDRFNDETIWYKAKDILQYPSQGELNKVIVRNGWVENELIVDNIMTLYERLKVNESINYFEVSGDCMDDVLDIFVRVNSGGTILSKTDLLFSTIVAYWQNARDEIDNFLSTVNNIGDHFEFNSDFIMRACLYALDMPIVMKVESFKQSNIDSIRAHWNNIKLSIKDTIKLISELGFSSENIVSNNAILPIVYYRLKKGKESLSNQEVKDDIRKYFVVAQTKKVFGNHSNQTLDILRSTLRDTQKFDYTTIKNIKLADGRTLACTHEDIDEWMSDFNKGPYTFLLLSLLYPDLKYAQEKFEQDHMHPYSGFAHSSLKKIILKDSNRQLSSTEVDDWIAKRDTLPNLQLLTSTENENKLKMRLKDWLSSGHADRYLPESDDDYEFRDFINFYNARKKILQEKLESILLR